MAHDSGFWTWPTDIAARQSNASGWAMTSAAVYAIGALLMLAPALRPAASDLALAGLALMLSGIAVSMGVLGRVLVTRSRLTYR